MIRFLLPLALANLPEERASADTGTKEQNRGWLRHTQFSLGMRVLIARIVLWGRRA